MLAARGMECSNAAVPVLLDAILLQRGSIVPLTAAVKHLSIFEARL